jgi:hypothetical protein
MVELDESLTSYFPAAGCTDAVACVRNSCSGISMAAIPRSERTPSASFKSKITFIVQFHGPIYRKLRIAARVHINRIGVAITRITCSSVRFVISGPHTTQQSSTLHWLS